mgnify:CR=1 FL=1
MLAASTGILRAFSGQFLAFRFIGRAHSNLQGVFYQELALSYRNSLRVFLILTFKSKRFFLRVEAIRVPLHRCFAYEPVGGGALSREEILDSSGLVGSLYIFSSLKAYNFGPEDSRATPFQRSFRTSLPQVHEPF